MPRVKSQAWGFYQGQAHLLSVRSQMSVTAAGPMWNRKPKEWGGTLRYYWLSGPHWGDPQKFWECTCSSCVPSETGHIYPHLDRSLCHCPLLISAPHSGRLWLCVHDEYSFCGPPLAAEARAREMAGCTGPRGAGTVADGGCGGFGGGSGGLRTPRVQALVLGLVFDPPLKCRSAAALSSGSSGLFQPVLGETSTGARRWTLWTVAASPTATGPCSHTPRGCHWGAGIRGQAAEPY